MTDEGEDEMYGRGLALDSLPDDVMMPVQFFGRLRNTYEEDGCHRLIYAILDDSVATYLYRRTTTNGGYAGPTKRERLYAEAKAWLFEERYVGPFSCTWICDHLGIEVTMLRKGLRAWDSEGRVPLRMPRRSPVSHDYGIRLPCVRTRRYERLRG